MTDRGIYNRIGRYNGIHNQHARAQEYPNQQQYHK